MSGAVIDRAYLEIDGDQLDCDSIDITMDDGSDFVTAMTQDNEPLGVAAGNRKYNVRAELTMLQDEEVDFHQLWVDKDEIACEVQFENGVTYAWDKCVLANPSVGARHGEKVTWSVELLCRGLAIS